MASSAPEWNLNRYCIAVRDIKNFNVMVKFLVAYLFVKPLLTVSLTFLVGIKNEIFLSLLHLTNSFSTDIKLWNEYGCFVYMCSVTDLKIRCCRDNTYIKSCGKNTHMWIIVFHFIFLIYFLHKFHVSFITQEFFVEAGLVFSASSWLCISVIWPLHCFYCLSLSLSIFITL